MRLRATSLALLLSVQLLSGQQVTRVYVEPFGSQPAAEQLRASVIELLKKEPGLFIVDSAAAADGVVAGSGDTYIKGYLGANLRIRYVNSDSRPVYGGYLSVELKDRQRDPVWSDLVTPSRFGSEDINKNLAEQVIKKLVPVVTGLPKSPKS